MNYIFLRYRIPTFAIRAKIWRVCRVRNFAAACFRGDGTYNIYSSGYHHRLINYTKTDVLYIRMFMFDFLSDVAHITRYFSGVIIECRACESGAVVYILKTLNSCLVHDAVLFSRPSIDTDDGLSQLAAKYVHVLIRAPSRRHKATFNYSW